MLNPVSKSTNDKFKEILVFSSTNVFERDSNSSSGTSSFKSRCKLVIRTFTNWIEHCQEIAD